MLLAPCRGIALNPEALPATTISTPRSQYPIAKLTLRSVRAGWRASMLRAGRSSDASRAQPRHFSLGESLLTLRLSNGDVAVSL